MASPTCHSKWQRGASGKGSKLVAGALAHVNDWKNGLNAAGIQVGPQTTSAYQSGLQSKAAANFETGVQMTGSDKLANGAFGKGGKYSANAAANAGKWLQNMKNGMAK
jgi:hypothetical protein